MRRASQKSWIFHPAVPVLASPSPTAQYASPRPRPPQPGGSAASLAASRFSTDSSRLSVLDSRIRPSLSHRLTPPDPRFSTRGSRFSSLVSHTLWHSIESTIRTSFESVARPNRIRPHCARSRPSGGIHEDPAPAAPKAPIGGSSAASPTARGHALQSHIPHLSRLPLTQRARRLVLYFGGIIVPGLSLENRDMIALHYHYNIAAQKR